MDCKIIKNVANFILYLTNGLMLISLLKEFATNSNKSETLQKISIVLCKYFIIVKFSNKLWPIRIYFKCTQKRIFYLFNLLLSHGNCI